MAHTPMDKFIKVHYADGASEDWYGVNVRTVNTIILYNNGRNEYQ